MIDVIVSRSIEFQAGSASRSTPFQEIVPSLAVRPATNGPFGAEFRTWVADTSYSTVPYTQTASKRIRTGRIFPANGRQHITYCHQESTHLRTPSLHAASLWSLLAPRNHDEKSCDERTASGGSPVGALALDSHKHITVAGGWPGESRAADETPRAGASHARSSRSGRTRSRARL